jgi:cytidylate kinase
VVFAQIALRTINSFAFQFLFSDLSMQIWLVTFSMRGSFATFSAKLKIFLTASTEIRAKRRHLQLINRGLTADYQAILDDLTQRDLRDSQRSAAPLKQMPDAILLNTSEQSIQEAVDFILNAYQNIV